MNFDGGVVVGVIVVPLFVLLSLSLSQRHTDGRPADDYQNLHSIKIRFSRVSHSPTFFDCITPFVRSMYRNIKHLFSISAAEWHTRSTRTTDIGHWHISQSELWDEAKKREEKENKNI